MPSELARWRLLKSARINLLSSLLSLPRLSTPRANCQFFSLQMWKLALAMSLMAQFYYRSEQGFGLIVIRISHGWIEVRPGTFAALSMYVCIGVVEVFG